ncbi:hypothetical protein BH24ACT26_BH24ACT26_22500 [soil metagenome]
MIVRILGEGQFDVTQERLEKLNELDEQLVTAVEGGNVDAYGVALEELLAGVRAGGRRLPDDYLGPSELVLPGADASIEEVRALLSEEGLIPD